MIQAAICPKCNSNMDVEENNINKTIRCPYCNEKILVKDAIKCYKDRHNINTTYNYSNMYDEKNSAYEASSVKLPLESQIEEMENSNEVYLEPAIAPGDGIKAELEKYKKKVKRSNNLIYNNNLGKNLLVIISFLFCTPLGLFLMWHFNAFNKKVRLVVSCIVSSLVSGGYLMMIVCRANIDTQDLVKTMLLAFILGATIPYLELAIIKLVRLLPKYKEWKGKLWGFNGCTMYKKAYVLTYIFVLLNMIYTTIYFGMYSLALAIIYWLIIPFVVYSDFDGVKNIIIFNSKSKVVKWIGIIILSIGSSLIMTLASPLDNVKIDDDGNYIKNQNINNQIDENINE